MITRSDTPPVLLNELVQLNQFQCLVAEWAAVHSNDDFFRKFFREFAEETQQHENKLASHILTQKEYGELRNLKSEWQGLLNMAAMRAEGMRSADFLAFTDKLFALRLKTTKSLLTLHRLNEKLQEVLVSHYREIMLLRESMGFLVQYEPTFSKIKQVEITLKASQAA